ncbi:MAG TPA: hypothetical protein VEU52_03275, partial [Candidatus Limnocylindrales bacterium]|nr:hypothetical protein [Candidatus Limnocylindrales bacterium]
MARFALLAFACLLGGILPLLALAPAGDVSPKARDLHFHSIVVDTHDDTTQRLLNPKFDLAARNPDGNIDIPRMREGGLDAIFFSIWMSGSVTGPVAGGGGGGG